MNPLYQQMMNMVPQSTPVQRTEMPRMQFANPMLRASYILQAMRNPAAFIRQNLPQIPEQAFQDPSGNGVLQYMMNNLGVTQTDVQNAMNQMPRF